MTMEGAEIMAGMIMNQHADERHMRSVMLNTAYCMNDNEWQFKPANWFQDASNMRTRMQC